MAVGHLVVGSEADLQGIEAELTRQGSLLVTGPRLEHEQRWSSPGEPALTSLHHIARRTGAVLAVEADGSRGMPIKVPGPHEPLVPTFTNTLVPVVGAEAFGAGLSEGVVHRPEIAAGVLDEPLGVELTPERVARLLASPEGGLKGRPPGADVRVIINQVDAPGRQAAATACGQALTMTRDIGAVILASLAAEDPVRQVIGRAAGVILAAGGSRRLGRPKLLERWKGEPLLRYAVRAALAGGLAPVVVVLGDRAGDLGEAIQDLPAERIINPNWESGQSVSLKLGLGAIQAEAEAVVFLLGDMPLVTPELIANVVQAHASSLAPIVIPRTEGRRGNPVLFDRSTFDTLARIEGDTGGRAVFDQFDILYVQADERSFFDLDTQEDLDWLERQP